MNAKKRAELCNAFREAKKYLWDGSLPVARETTFICWAIGAAWQRQGITESARDRALQLIHSRLDGYGTVISWLCNTTDIDAHQYRSEIQQEYRHRWLDSLIAEFS